MSSGPNVDRRRRRGARAVGLAFALLLFVLLPAAAIALNGRLGWPEWHSRVLRWAGLGLMLAGLGLLGRCALLLLGVGEGTPSPLDPPHQLVVAGPYRRTRNPIYVADALILLGLFGLLGHLALLVYALLGVVILHLAVVFWEEPGLLRRFGEDYAAYVRHVPRWLPGRRRTTP